MRLLAVTIAAGLAVTGCAAAPSETGSGAGPGRGGDALPSGSGWVSWTDGSGSGSGAGTGSSDPGSGSSSGSQQVDPRCPAELNGQYNTAQAKPVPSGFKVDWVLRCTVVEPQGSRPRSVRIERSISDPANLLAALRAPDEARHDGPCPAIAMVVPYFALMQPDGKPFLPRMPLTACALPQEPAMQALNGLRFEVIAEKPLP